ncbi:MAG: hypothetical protein WC761_01395 [Candidatus Paceibacterota bacterium]|jgi:hypothetical protein
MVDQKDNKTRQNIPQDPRNPKPHLDSGYENSPSLNFTIPPCGIEDIDAAIHRLFDKTIGFDVQQVRTQTGVKNVSKPFTIFATGERFALVKRLNPPRDKQKALILPAISIRRTSIEQSSDELVKRGMNQFTGNITIKRKLDASDRDYQNLVNKQGLQHLQNVLSGLPTTTRTTGELANTIEVIEGGLLGSTINANNIYEIITVPQPQFFTAVYEVVFWTSYTQHMTYMIQTYMASFLPQIRGHKLETDKGYWFISNTEDSFQNGENIDDFSNEQRVTRYTFNVRVKGYLFAPQYPTNAVPVRRWVSCPNIVFDVIPVAGEVQPKKLLNRPPIKDTSNNPFTLSEIEEDPQIAQTPTTLQRYAVKKTVVDPVSGKRRIKYVSILDSNQAKGETVYAASDIETVEQFILSPNKQ